MRKPLLSAALALLALAALPLLPERSTASAEPQQAAGDPAELRAAKELKPIRDKTERSRALFAEAGKVFTHPRCVNCHPAGDAPLQGESGDPHEPPVRGGKLGLGIAGLKCKTCHQKENFDPGRVPGAPAWHLAPLKMAWEGLSLGEICAQLKDPERNGGRTLAEIVEHSREDHLVAWGWDPGAGREPAPGDQETFGDLVAAWVKTGAACPE